MTRGGSLESTDSEVILPPRTLRDLRAERAAEKQSHKRGNGVNGNVRIASAFEQSKKPTSKDIMPENASDYEDQGLSSSDRVDVSLTLLEQIPSRSFIIPPSSGRIGSCTPNTAADNAGSIRKTVRQGQQQVRGRIGRYWGTITSHQYIDQKLWFWILWDMVELEESNPSLQDESDFSMVGQKPMVDRYKSLHSL